MGNEFDKGFLDGLDAKLLAIYQELDLNAVPARVQDQAKAMCRKVTHSDRQDFGLEKNKLLLWGWKASWKREKIVYSLEFLKLPGITEKQREYLYKVFCHLVHFACEDKVLLSDLIAELQRALGSYLRLRGYKLGPFTPHAFGLLIDERKRLIRRAGYSKDVDLSSSCVGWHIFRIVLKAAPSQASIVAMKRDYPGEWEARGPAVNSLNRRLKAISLRVENRTLKSLSGA